MERAAAEKPRIVELADRIAGRFVWAVLLVSALTALGWGLVDGQRALWITVSVLVVTCPCALALATPIALTVAAGALARDGLLVTRGHAIETLARATHFVFDKTGTLTVGRLQLLDVMPLAACSREHCLELAAALEAASEHPVAKALVSAAGVAAAATEIRNEPGGGVEGVAGGRRLRIGRPDYALALGALRLPEAATAWLDSGDTVVVLADAEQVLALFRLGDEVRPEAGALVAALQAAGRQVILLSGDAPAVAARVGRVLGIGDIRGGATPQGKYDAVVELQRAGALVAMVGDGVNDAPVLAQAQVSVAMGAGAQLA
ncbi:MAG TPA: HAD-IC family P-type ATPase, partial [Rhodocyclaceae bacterium]|nr:HAD-IC family P-type ATPase [Rhodocyclaceae bacterium]